MCAYVSADIYVLIEDCESYNAAIQKLKSIYIKSPYIIFARLLATRKQKPGESLPEFLQALHVLSKDCSFTDVTAEVYRYELVGDAFINGLTSQHIRQRLLENKELTVDEAFEIARSLHMAQEYSATYAAERSLVSAVSPSQQATDVADFSLPVEKLSSAGTGKFSKSGKFSKIGKFSKNFPVPALESAPKVARKCYFCGQLYLRRD